MSFAYLALAAAVLIGVVAQLLLKTGAGAPTFVDQLFRPSSIAGIAGYGVAALLYMVAIRQLPLSIAYPSISFSYVLVAVLAWWLWGEPLGWSQLAGIGLILSGVVLLGRVA